MSAVVLRCPNCGTTQSTTGLCDACHEADVRYFCPNHKPGRWLDGPKCDQCGAEFGREPVAPPRPPPSRPRRPASPTPTTGSTPPRRRVPVETPESTRRPPRTPSPPPTYDEPPPPRRRAPVGVRREPPVAPSPTSPTASVEELLEELRRRGRTPDVGPPRVPRAPAAGIATAIGCFTRLVLTAFILIVLGVAALYFLVGGNVQSWFVDVGQSVGVVGGVPEQTQRGIDAFRAGDYTTATRELEEAARVYRNSGLALLYLARIRADAGDLEGSGEYLMEAVRREPENAIARRELAEYFVARAHQLRDRRAAGAGTASAGLIDASLRSAGDEFARSLMLDPTDNRTRTGYACVIGELGDRASAERMLAEIGSSVAAACR